LAADQPLWRSPATRNDVLLGGAPAALAEAETAKVGARIGPQAYATFARATRQAAQLDWRDSLGQSGFVPLNALPADQRAAAANAIRPVFAQLAGLLNDPEIGHIAAAMLTIESADAMFWNGQRACVAGWGGWPHDVFDAAAAHRLFTTTIAEFVALRAPPLIPGAPRAGERPPWRGLRGPAVAAAVALALLALALWPGVLRHGGTWTLPVGDDRDAINRALQQRIADFDALATSPNLCGLQGPSHAIVVPHGQGDGARGDPSPALGGPPIDPSAISVAPTPGGQTAPNNLASLLEAATVFIVHRDGDKLSTGSGFFIAPDLVMTNAHVTGPVGSTVQLGNHRLARLVEAVVEKRTPSHDPGTPDFAVLRTVDYANPSFLSFSTELQPRQPVVAVGFPGIVIEFDRAFERILHGDLSASPETVFSDGTVMVIQNRDSDLPFVHHLALISQGSSGGPLADACGRVVGVNSLVGNEGNGTNRTNVSLASKGALKFLADNGMQAKLSEGLCRLDASAAAPPSPQAARPSPAPPDPAIAPAPAAPSASPSAPAR